MTQLMLAAILILPAAGLAPPAATPPSSDRLATDQGELTLHAVRHASFVLLWAGKAVYVDPVGSDQAYQAFPKADLVLVTDIHRDHLDPATIAAVLAPAATIVAPPAVRAQLPAQLAARTIVLPNGRQTSLLGVHIEAVPMYNTTPSRLRFHPKGRGNGYVLTLGGLRFYISGDTEDIPEMLALRNIDAAVLCMNLPYTMSVDQAARAVRAFKPKIVYPYHFRGQDGLSDLDRFGQLVRGAGVEVRELNWYP